MQSIIKMKVQIIHSETITLCNKKIILNRKHIKTLRLTIDKRTAEIKINAPRTLSLAKIETFVKDHIDWIEKNQHAILVRTNQIKDLALLKSLTLFGDDYHLKLRQAKQKRYSIDGQTITLFVKEYNNEEIQEAINKCYRTELSYIVTELQKKCETITKEKISHIQLRTMKTLLGSCKPSERKITLNTQLAKYPINCIQMVLLHEIAHFKELSHNEKFKKLLTSYCPDWRELRKKMKQV